MTLKWKPGEGKYAGKESVFWEAFKKDGDIGVVSKFRGAGDGYIPIVGATAEAGGYSYSTKAVQKKDMTTGAKLPNEFWYFVERKKIATTGDPIVDGLPESEEKEAHKSVQNANWDDRQARIDKAHQENLEVQKRQAQALENLNETMAAILQVLRELRATQPA